MDPNIDRNRKKIAIAGLAVLIIGSLVFLLAAPGNEDQASTSATQEEQTTGAEAQQVQTGVKYEGFGDLSQHGYTEVQMSGIYYALFQYAPKATNFAITVSTIKDDPYDPASGKTTTFSRFNVTIDKKTTYNASVEKYLDFNTVRVQLSSNGKVVYASEPIDTSKVRPENVDTLED